MVTRSEFKNERYGNNGVAMKLEDRIEAVESEVFMEPDYNEPLLDLNPQPEPCRHRNLYLESYSADIICHDCQARFVSDGFRLKPKIIEG